MPKSTRESPAVTPPEPHRGSHSDEPALYKEPPVLKPAKAGHSKTCPHSAPCPHGDNCPH